MFNISSHQVSSDNRSAHPGLRPFSASLPMALLRAREAAMRRFRPMLAEHGLTEQQWRVLRALSAAGEPLEVGVLAERTFLLPPSLSRILAKLERSGIVDRTVAPHDLRRSLIGLTGAGRRLVSEIGPESEEIYGSIEAGFGAERLQRLLSELHELAALDFGSSGEVDDGSRVADEKSATNGG